MLEVLLKNRLIDYQGLLLVSYKQFGLSEEELVMIMLVLRLEQQGQKGISPTLLSRYMTLPFKKIDQLIAKLINQKYLSYQEGSVSAKPIIRMILMQEELNQQQEESSTRNLDLISLFENEFGRCLTPIELETIRKWKQCAYSDEMIFEALKEATLSHVHNMRYIDKILIDWSRHGMKKSGRERYQEAVKDIKIDDYEWWNED